MKEQDINIVEISKFFKAISDSTRFKILLILMEEETKVQDLSNKLNMSISAISHQLAKLRSTRLVKYRKEGKEVFYSLDDGHVKMIIETTIEHISHKDCEC